MQNAIFEGEKQRPLIQIESILNMKQKYKLMIVDDDAAIRRGMKMYLSHCGFDVIEAENCTQSVAIFLQNKPDLIISDLYLPQLSGLDLLSKIRQHCSETPFVVISGSGVMSDVVQALRLGANDYLTKPIDMNLLEHSVASALQSAKLKNENRKYREKLESVVRSLKEKVQILRIDHKAGKKVQQDILPPCPFNQGQYQLKHCIIPSLYLSGDYVDIFSLNDNLIGFYLADVSGHGASSAFITVLLKHMTINWIQQIQAQENSTADTTVKPSCLLGYLNQQLLKTDLGKHVTIFCGIVDSTVHRLTFSAAGHYPFPVIMNTDRFELLKMANLPLGLSSDVTYENADIDLHRGDALTIFSDGVLDLFRQTGQNGKQQQLISKIKCEGTPDNLIKWLLSNIPEKSADDITLLTMERK